MKCTFWLTPRHQCGEKAFAALANGARCEDHALMLCFQVRRFADAQFATRGVDEDYLARLGYRELRR